MEFDYVALCWFGDTQESIDANLKERMQQLTSEGWEEYIRASWIAQHESGVPGGACIMRRPKDEGQKYFHTRHCLCDECARKKDEPRMWTEKGLVELMKRTWLVNPSPGQRMKEESNG